MFKTSKMLAIIFCVVISTLKIFAQSKESAALEAVVSVSKETPTIKCLKGSSLLYTITLTSFDVNNDTFVVDYQILFPKEFKVTLDKDTRALDALGQEIEQSVTIFVDLNNAPKEAAYYFKLANFSFKDKGSDTSYSIDFFLPKASRSEYSIFENSGNSFVLKRKGRINERLMSSLKYRMGTESNFFSLARPDDFLCEVESLKAGKATLEKVMLFFPWN